jgi:hypothetical protein
MSLINYVTKTLIGGLWGSLLYVAEGVRDGKRPQHREAIEAKADLYRWIEHRSGTMLQKLMRDFGDEEFVSYLQR